METTECFRKDVTFTFTGIKQLICWESAVGLFDTNYVGAVMLNFQTPSGILPWLIAGVMSG
jgi:hypothetical protein